jgi:class 3 adenylate cyclase
VSTSRISEKLGLSRRALLVTIQHELRSPVLNIIGYARVLRDESSQVYNNDLSEILQASNNLLELIDDFLDHGPRTSSHVSDPEGVDTLSRLRHDLRGPVNIIRGYAEFLLQLAATRHETRVERDLRRIYRLTDSMLGVVNRLTHEIDADENKEKSLEIIHPELRLVTQALRTLESLESNTEVQAIPARVLVVDDNEQSRDLLCRQLRKEGHDVEVAKNGRKALHMLRSDYFDIVLLDIIMPELNGYQVLVEMKKQKRLRQIPVIMISTLDEVDSVVRCIELGADEYLPKSSHPALLRARLAASLEKKRLRDRERHYLEQIRMERERSERLLFDILPNAIVERLKNGEKTIADDVAEVTVLFCGIVGFTEFSARLSAAEVVRRLNEVFLQFDTLVEKHGLEKIKTIGDAYLVVGGLPGSNPGHAQAIAKLALDMRDTMADLNNSYPEPLEFRTGIHTGPIVAGVIGRKRFTYDVWGNAVNIANRMESHSLPGKIQVSESTHELLQDAFLLEYRGKVLIKGAGEMTTYFLNGQR